MKITNQKTKRIYKRAMAEFLIEQGCTLVKRVPDLVNDKHFNWIFIDDELLTNSMSQFPRKQED